MTNKEQSTQSKRRPGRPRKETSSAPPASAGASAVLPGAIPPASQEFDGTNQFSNEMEDFAEMAAVQPAEPEEGGGASLHRTDSPFSRFLALLEPETRNLLGEDELHAIFAAQQEKARAERRAAAKKSAADQALTEARIAEGLIRPATAEEIELQRRLAEPVFFTIDMPSLGDGIVDIGMRVDQKIYLNGERYKLTRAQYESMRSNLYIARQNELLFEGKDRRHWLRRQATGRVNGHIEFGEETA